MIAGVQGDSEVNLSDQIAKQFRGDKKIWRKPYDALLEKVKRFGGDVVVSPTNSYIRIFRKDHMFAIVQVSAERLDIGIKLKDVRAIGRFTSADEWNDMVTHHVQITDPVQLDEELLSWLHQSYERVKK